MPDLKAEKGDKMTVKWLLSKISKGVFVRVKQQGFTIHEFFVGDFRDDEGHVPGFYDAIMDAPVKDFRFKFYYDEISEQEFCYLLVETKEEHI